MYPTGEPAKAIGIACPPASKMFAKAEAIGSVKLTLVLAAEAVGVIVKIPLTVTTLPTRIHWQTFAERAVVFATFVSVGVYVPDAMHWFVVPVTAPALL